MKTQNNISKDLSNNNFRYSNDKGATWKDVTIPCGLYEINEIDEEIKRQMFHNGDYNKFECSNDSAEKHLTSTGVYELTWTNPNVNGKFNIVGDFYINLYPNVNTMKLVFEIKNNNFQIDLTSSNNLGSFLGFNSKILVDNVNEAENIFCITSKN